MAIHVMTATPNKLLKNIKAAIDGDDIVTWSYDEEGDFIHTASSGQWEGKAWLRPNSQSGVLVFGLLGKEGVTMTKVIYGVYHGRFVEMLLTHFDDEFSHINTTAKKGAEDDFKVASR